MQWFALHVFVGPHLTNPFFTPKLCDPHAEVEEDEVPTLCTMVVLRYMDIKQPGSDAQDEAMKLLFSHF